jgi:copper(I)-binding protein
MTAGLTACGSANKTPSLGADYPNAEVGSMAARSVLLVASPDGKNANVVMTLVNHGTEPDTLRQVTASRADRDGRPQALVFIQVSPGSAVNVGSPGQDAVVIQGIDAVARPGEVVDLELLFETAGGATVTTIVQSPTGFYASYTPTGLPSPTSGPSLSGTPTPGATSSPTGSVTPTGTPTGSPT